jgi:hypothetical protein
MRLVRPTTMQARLRSAPPSRQQPRSGASVEVRRGHSGPLVEQERLGRPTTMRLRRERLGSLARALVGMRLEQTTVRVYLVLNLPRVCDFDLCR